MKVNLTQPTPNLIKDKLKCCRCLQIFDKAVLIKKGNLAYNRYHCADCDKYLKRFGKSRKILTIG